MELTVQGHPVFAATGGTAFDPAKPAVVLIHGSGMDHTVWSLPARYLAHHDRSVLAVDLPGHGRSAGPALTSITALADWIADVIDAAGLTTAALVGHSMGALTALETAACHPDRVRELALLGVAERMPVHPGLLAAASADDPAARAMVVGWGFGTRAHCGGGAVPGLWQVGGGLRLMERAPPGVLGIDLAACNAYDNGAAAAAAVRCPTLLLLGARDRMTPAKAGQALGALIAGARVTMLPDTGHMMMVEQPNATIDALVGAV
jgi:pimeloyl-ACP methyl ester carboxylesterase